MGAGCSSEQPRLILRLDSAAALLHLSAQPARSKARHMTACSAHRPNHMEEMITGQEIAAQGQRKQSFCTDLNQSCPLFQLAARPLAWPPAALCFVCSSSSSEICTSLLKLLLSVFCSSLSTMSTYNQTSQSELMVKLK